MFSSYEHLPITSMDTAAEHDFSNPAIWQRFTTLRLNKDSSNHRALLKIYE